MWDVYEQLVIMLITSKKFAAQSPDVENCSVLMVYVFFINPANRPIEEFLLTKNLTARTMGEAFWVLDRFVTESSLEVCNPLMLELAK